jgi:hypothetical protein
MQCFWTVSKTFSCYALRVRNRLSDFFVRVPYNNDAGILDNQQNFLMLDTLVRVSYSDFF